MPEILKRLGELARLHRIRNSNIVQETILEGSVALGTLSKKRFRAESEGGPPDLIERFIDANMTASLSNLITAPTTSYVQVTADVWNPTGVIDLTARPAGTSHGILRCWFDHSNLALPPKATSSLKFPVCWAIEENAAGAGQHHVKDMRMTVTLDGTTYTCQMMIGDTGTGDGGTILNGSSLVAYYYGPFGGTILEGSSAAGAFDLASIVGQTWYPGPWEFHVTGLTNNVNHALDVNWEINHKRTGTAFSPLVSVGGFKTRFMDLGYE